MHHDTPLVRRRTVTRTAAWAVPVIATVVAAPAYAATSGSCTQRGSGTLATGVVGKHKNVVTGVVFPGNVTATVAITQTRHGKAVDPLSDAETGRIFRTDYGTPWSYVRLHHAQGMTQGDTITMTVTFGQPVSNFGFTITDIDMDQGGWVDSVTLSPATFAIDAMGPNLTGDGSHVPFTADVEGNIDSAAGDVTVHWAQPASSFTITYVAADSGNDSDIGQMVGIGKFVYDNCL
jgi:hypothetical protein